MTFSSKSTYALLALLELAAEQEARVVMQVGELAERQQIPERYLEQMMTSLRRGGLLQSIRGPKGGYRLSRPAQQISIADVLSFIEGNLPSAAPLSGTAERQVIDTISRELQEQRTSKLQGTNLAQMVEQRNALLQAPTIYFI